MYILQNGLWEGSVSGGCLEGDVLKKARQVMDEEKPVILTYDTSEESNHELGINLGCNGIIHIHIQPIRSQSKIIEYFRKLISIDQNHLLITELDDSLNVSLIDEKDLVTTNEPLSNSIDKLLLKQSSGWIKEDNKHFFFERFEPTLDLLVIGGGGDAQPVVKLANQLGWNVRLTDECIAHVFPKNFPNTQVIQCDRKYIGQEVTTSDHTAAVLMTHNLDYDRDALIDLLATKTPYIGIVGPRKRWNKIQAQLEDRGISLTPDILKRIHAPVGLDIGAETREEIALSIISEIKAFFSGRKAISLKQRKGSIHQKDPITGEVHKTPQFNI